MQIDSIDFVAEELQKAAFFKVATYDSFSTVKAKMNEWLKSNDVEVVNIETVVLPSIHSPHEEGSEDVGINVNGEVMTTYSQFIRVWFRRQG